VLISAVLAVKTKPLETVSGIETESGVVTEAVHAAPGTRLTIHAGGLLLLTVGIHWRFSRCRHSSAVGFVSFMCSATAEIITRIKDETAFEIGPSHVQNAWLVKLPSVKTVQEQRKKHYALLEECYSQTII